jgi:hypothetical protein
LLHIVLHIRDNRNHNAFYNLIDFCVTVPRDRFYEILCSERDSYRYLDRFCSLDWSGIELSILLRKRIETAYKKRIDKEPKPEERLEALFRLLFPYIPWEIDLDYKGRSYRLPLFLYVLRHTFWRPRDILIYYSRILSVCKAFQLKKKEITSAILRRIVTDSTYAIIQTEFLNEFCGVVQNLPQIVERFSGVNNPLDYDEVVNRVGPVEFIAAQSGSHFSGLDEKLTFLYQIGFLGIEASPEQMEHHGLLMRDAFYFNEGATLIMRAGIGRFSGYKFLIHPIFSEYLNLRPVATQLILNPSWEDLHLHEASLQLLLSQLLIDRELLTKWKSALREDAQPE